MKNVGVLGDLVVGTCNEPVIPSQETVTINLLPVLVAGDKVSSGAPVNPVLPPSVFIDGNPVLSLGDPVDYHEVATVPHIGTLKADTNKTVFIGT